LPMISETDAPFHCNAELDKTDLEPSPAQFLLFQKEYRSVFSFFNHRLGGLITQGVIAYASWYLKD